MLNFIFPMVLFFGMSCIECQNPSPSNQGLDAHTYTNNAIKQEEWALDFFKNRYSFTGTEKRALDLGCGDGAITVKIAELFSNQFPQSAIEFIGMDISQSMIDKAHTNYPKEIYKNLSFIQGNAEQIQYKDYFDLIVSFSTLHFAMEQEKVIQEIYNSLAPNGFALILVPEKNAKNMNPLAGSLMLTSKWKTYFPQGYSPSRIYFSNKEYEQMLLKSGFKSVAVESILREDIYLSMEKFIDSLVAVLNYVPTEIRREFAIDLSNLLNIHHDSSGNIHYVHSSLQIVAKK